MLHLSENQKYEIADFIAKLIVKNNEWMSHIWVRQKAQEYWLLEEIDWFTERLSKNQ